MYGALEELSHLVAMRRTWIWNKAESRNLKNHPIQDKEYLEGLLTVAVQHALSYCAQLTAARLKLAGQYTCI